MCDTHGPLSVARASVDNIVCCLLLFAHLQQDNDERETMASIITHLLTSKSKIFECTWQHVVTQIHQQVTWTLLETT